MNPLHDIVSFFARVLFMNFLGDFSKHFAQYVAPFHPLSVLFGMVIVNALGGAMIAGMEHKNPGLWAFRSVMLVSVFTLIGGLVSSEMRRTSGSGLLGLFVGFVVGCFALIVLVMNSNE
jgi:hypothetical protein